MDEPDWGRWLMRLYILELALVVGGALLAWDLACSLTLLLVVPVLAASASLAREGRSWPAASLAAAGSAFWLLQIAAVRAACGAHSDWWWLADDFGWLVVENLTVLLLGLGRWGVARLWPGPLPRLPITATSLPLAQAAYVTAFAFALPVSRPHLLLAVPALLLSAWLAWLERPALGEAVGAAAALAWWGGVLPLGLQGMYAREAALTDVAIFGWVPLLSLLRVLARGRRRAAVPLPLDLLEARDARLARVAGAARAAFAWELAFVALLGQPGLLHPTDEETVLIAAPLLWLARKLVAERRPVAGLVGGWAPLSGWWLLGLCHLPWRSCGGPMVPLVCAWIPALNALLLAAALLWVTPLALEAAWRAGRG